MYDINIIYISNTPVVTGNISKKCMILIKIITDIYLLITGYIFEKCMILILYIYISNTPVVTGNISERYMILIKIN